MSQRGKVLRDPHAGPGLLIVEGQQYPFVLEQIWQSELPPKPGLAVNVDFDLRGKIQAITAVPLSQLAHEQADIARTAAKTKSAALGSGMVAKFGLSRLIAASILILGWLFLTSVSVQLPFLGRIDFTFWQTLGLLNSSNLIQAGSRHAEPSSGIYGLLALITLAGPFIQHLWNDKRAVFGGLLPLVFMLLIGIAVRSSLMTAVAGDMRFGTVPNDLQKELANAISLGLGAYLSLLASGYLAFATAKQFLARRTEAKPLESTQKAAA
jgi:hypothetical protein